MVRSLGLRVGPAGAGGGSTDDWEGASSTGGGEGGAARKRARDARLVRVRTLASFDVLSRVYTRRVRCASRVFFFVVLEESFF